MSSFSLRHILRLLFVLLYGWAFVMMRHDSEFSMSLPLNSRCAYLIRLSSLGVGV